MRRPVLAHPGFSDTDALLRFHRALFGGARMTADPGTGAPPPPAPPNPPPPGPPSPPSPPAPPGPPATPPAGYLPQDQVAAIATRERAAGERAAQEALVQQLGVPIEEAKRLLEAGRAAEDAGKTEQQRATDAANAEKAAAEQAKGTAAQAEHRANLVTALVLAGVEVKDKEGKRDTSKVESLTRLIDVPAGAKPEEIDAAIEKCKADFPALFQASEPAPEIDPKTGKPKVQPPPAPGSDPKGTPPRGTGSEDAFARGQARAQKHGNHGRAYPPEAKT